MLLSALAGAGQEGQVSRRLQGIKTKDSDHGRQLGADNFPQGRGVGGCRQLRNRSYASTDATMKRDRTDRKKKG
jgi:hypothetical protein